MKDDQDEQGKSKEKSEQSNVIRFPIEKVKQKNRLKRLAGKVGDSKKTTLFLSLLSVLVVSFYLLQGVQTPDRYLANTVDNRDISKEKALNEALQDPDRRVPASYGRSPTAEERLREQELNRGYTLKYNGIDGLVMEITYFETEDVLHRPVYLQGGPREFLLRNREAITPGFDDVEGEMDHFLLKRGSEPVAEVRFRYFDNGKLDSMKVQLYP